MVLKLVKLAKNKINIGKNVKIKFVKDRPGHDTRYSLDSSKIMNSLKWKPKTNINKGLNETFEWYKNNYKYFAKLNKKDILRRLGVNKW